MKFGLRHIRYFVAVAEELHFRRAATRLNVAQPAISRAIGHLESELGFALFDRTGRRVALTAAGASFLVGCRRLLTGMDTAIDEARDVDAGRIGSLRVGYTDFAISGALPGILTEFQRLHPGITLKPRHGVTRDQLIALAEGTLDIGFVTGPIALPGFGQHPIQAERLVCVVHEGHRLARRASIRMADLAGEDFVLGPARDWSHFHQELYPICRRAGFSPNVVQEAYNSAAILGLVASRMGLTILTESVATPARPGLVTLPIKGLSERLATVAIWAEDQPDGPRRLFVKHLRQR